MANSFINRTQKNVGTEPATLYTVGNQTQTTVIGINIANTSTSNIETDIIIKLPDSTEIYLVKGCPINRNSSLAAMGGDQKLVLETGNELIIKTNKDNSADVIISALEVTT